MRAQYVYENISFERGTDPRDSMGIGETKVRAEQRLREFLKKQMDEVVSEVGGEYTIRRARKADWESNVLVKVVAYYIPEGKLENEFKLEAWIYDPEHYTDKGYSPKYTSGAVQWRWLQPWGSDFERADINSKWFYVPGGIKRKTGWDHMSGSTYNDEYPTEHFIPKMRRRTVRESVQFERGKDPLKTLGIGIIEELDRKIRSLNKNWGLADQTEDWELASWVNPYTSGRTFYISLLDEKGLKTFPRKHRSALKDPDGLYIYYSLGSNVTGLVTLEEFLDNIRAYL